MKRFAPDYEKDPANDAAEFVQADQPKNHEESIGAGKNVINMVEVVRNDFSDTSVKVETDKPDAAAEHQKTTQQNKVAKTTTKDAKYKAQETTSLHKESAQLTSEKDTNNIELSTPSEDQLFQPVAAALADVTGPCVDWFVQLKQADGFGSVVVFHTLAGGRRRGQIGKVDDGSVCKVLSIDEQSESYCIASCQSGWHCNTDVRDGWIAARNALVMMPDDAVQQADEGAATAEDDSD